MSLCNNTSVCTTVAETVSCSLSVVFIIVALGVLVFFKMYRKFIYRLLLYAFVALITALFGLTANLLMQTIIIVQGQQVEFETFTNNSIIIFFHFTTFILAVYFCPSFY